MKIAAFSHEGSIREQNQDVLLIDEKLHLAIMVDGSGPQGREAAEQAARAIWLRISDIAHVTSAGESVARLNEAIESAVLTVSDRFGAATTVSPAAIWVNRGIVSAVVRGHCAMATGNDGWQPNSGQTGSWPVQSGQRFALMSEGIATLCRDARYLSSSFPANAGTVDDDETADDENRLSEFARQTAELYDGDDRTMIMIRIEKSDLTAGEMHELELFEHYNKEYSFPVWAPLAAAAGIAASGLFAAFKLRKFLPKLPLKKF